MSPKPLNAALVEQARLGESVLYFAVCDMCWGPGR
jgi:hypothetical protein